MRIALSLIRESSQKIRSSWDEEALNELAQSIKEQGVIVPVKVRPNDKGYELIYGHRRTEGARRAGLIEIEAIVEGMEDTDALIQALIENVMREDLAPMDTARGLQALIDTTGWSGLEIQRRGIMSDEMVSKTRALLKEDPSIQSMIAAGSGSGDVPQGKISPRHVAEVREAGISPGDRAAILVKAAREGLTSTQTRQVAESIVKAKNPEHRQHLLDTPYSSFIHDPANVEANERAFIAGQPSAQREWDETPTSKALALVLTEWRKTMADMIVAAKIGKISPEQRRFIADRLERFANEMLRVAEELRA